MEMRKVEPMSDAGYPPIIIYYLSGRMRIENDIKGKLKAEVEAELSASAGPVLMLFDMSDITHFDSSGMGELVTCIRKCGLHSRFRFAILNPSRVVMAFLKPTKLEELGCLMVIRQVSETVALAEFRQKIATESEATQ